MLKFILSQNKEKSASVSSICQIAVFSQPVIKGRLRVISENYPINDFAIG